MNLSVRRLTAECRASRGLEHVAGVVDTVARGRLRDDLGARLGPSLDRGTEVVRIRRLPLRVALRASDLNEQTLSEAWVTAFVQALFVALAAPAGDEGPYALTRYATRAAQMAALARDALAGHAAGRWEYAEFHASGAALDPVRVFALCGDAGELGALLMALAELGVLDELLCRLDELALERLFVRLAVSDMMPAVTTATLLRTLEASVRLAQRIESTGDVTLRRTSLRLYALFGDGAHPPRTIFHALLAAVCLIESPSLLVRADEPLDVITGRRLPIPAAEFLDTVRRGETGLTSPVRNALAHFAENALSPALRASVPFFDWARDDPSATQTHSGETAATDTKAARNGTRGRASADQSISTENANVSATPDRQERVAHGARQTHADESAAGRAGSGPVATQDLAPSPAAIAARRGQPIWLTSDVAALFLLAPLVPRIGWLALRRQLGPRDFSFLLIAIGERIVKREIDAAMALFGGCAGELDHRGLRSFIDTTDHDLDAMADLLVAEVRLRIRGFRQSPLPAIVRQFIRKPGRIRVEDEHLTIVLDPNPFHVALRLSGIDERVDSVEWLDGRALDFILEGL